MELENKYLVRLAENIERILKIKNMRQQDLAEKSGLSCSFVSEITNLKANPSINNIERIAKALDVSLHVLFITPGENYHVIESTQEEGYVWVLAHVTKPEAYYIKKMCEGKK